ncbi:MAG: lycopene cyclase family protein [Truepera sp.]|nr:lycopene cyclase family protein [Truepera sp.]
MDDLLVVGAGPAGLAITAAAVKEGLSVVNLSPGGVTPWRNTYGIWQDELMPLGLADLLANRWQDVSAYFGPEETVLRRAYGRLDNDRLQAHLLDCVQGRVRWLPGTAVGVRHDERGSSLSLGDGQEVAARLVIDASGHNPALVTRPPHAPLAYQAAYGVLGTFTRPPLRPGQLLFMDYRKASPDHKPCAQVAGSPDHSDFPAASGPPTFLYGMDLGDGRFFLEETSLAARPAVGFAQLKDRLEQRLAQLGTALREVHDTERVLFPMNAPLPAPQRVIGFGGAAGMVHPASGYMIGSVLTFAPLLAASLRRGLDRGLPLEQIARQAWATLWSDARQRQRQLYLLGLEALMSFDTPQIRSHFASFFALPEQLWQGYLSGTLSTSALADTMWQLFRRAPPALRLALMRSALGRGSGPLWQAFKPRLFSR